MYFHFAFVVLLITEGQTAKLPSDIGRCHLNDSKLDDCLTKNVELAIRKFKDGAPKLGIPRFEPLSIPKLIIGGGGGPVNVRQDLENVTIYGLTASKITKYRAQLDQDKIYTESVTPHLEVLADYKMQGRISILPLRGKGKCNITLVNSKITHVLLGETRTEKGRKYFALNDYKVTIDPQHVHYHFDGLFDNDRRLANEINHVVNENWDALYGDLRAGYEESFGRIFKTLANNLFSRVPYDEIFLSS